MPGKKKRGIQQPGSPKKEKAVPAVTSAAATALKTAHALHKEAHGLYERSHQMRLAARSLRQGKRTPIKRPKPSVARGTSKKSLHERVDAPGPGKVLPGSEPHSALPFTVVGIGASAGGYEAVTELLHELPGDVGMAFILVQHLDPHYRSRLAELVAKGTKLRVAEIRNHLRIEPDCVYVLPSNTSVTLSGGRFRLGPRDPKPNPMPIDTFLRSLANEQQNRAIGILLSGGGTDGTLGIREIKGMGGLTIAQDKGSAKQFGMPGSAIAAGAVDLVLSPKDMAEELRRLASHPYIAAGEEPGKALRPIGADAARAENLFVDSSEELRVLFSLLRTRKGVDFSLYKPGTLNRRIMRRMALHKANTLAGYVKMLQDSPDELEALFHDLLINVTGFFRDAAVFRALKKRLLPRLLKHRADDVPIRIWSCGCATGEEAYSLAITISEFLEENRRVAPVQIFASDLNERAIERARTGMYHENILLDVSPERLRRFFVRTDGFYQVRKHIRDLCLFARQNIVVDPPFSNLDLISCRMCSFTSRRCCKNGSFPCSITPSSRVVFWCWAVPKRSVTRPNSSSWMTRKTEFI
jgi:two-component system, chemotaxis family, CheB/CheR fusion protein